MRILFISRAHPPVIGGIERQNYEICEALSRGHDVFRIVNTKGKKFLPIFLPMAALRSLVNLKDCDVVLLGDGVLAVFGWLIKRFSDKPVVCIVHGLDITYHQFIYRTLWTGFFFRYIDQFISVGRETVRQAEYRGLDASRFTVIANGVNTLKLRSEYERTDLVRILGHNPPGAVLLTLGRLVRRKGVSWFVREVLPLLDESVTYIVAGTGEDDRRIKSTIAEFGLQKRVIMLGEVSETDKEILLQTVDLFVQPNIKVAHDTEGFGLVVLESALQGTFVVASRLEGLVDAIEDGVNGSLVEAGNPLAYKSRIESLLKDPDGLSAMGERARRFVIDRFGWDAVAASYERVMSQLVDGMVLRQP
jgi:glycosyltransferase involved in cell wall biosynthesis